MATTHTHKSKTFFKIIKLKYCAALLTQYETIQHTNPPRNQLNIIKYNANSVIVIYSYKEKQKHWPPIKSQLGFW